MPPKIELNLIADLLLSVPPRRDLCERLLAADSSLTPLQKCTKITRLLRLLRAHGLIQKVPKTHRYQLTPTAPETLTALIQARQASVKKLANLAA